MKPLNPQIQQWSDKKVWIVGASSGIGHALARELQQQGARLILTARRTAPLQSLATEVDRVIAADVTDEESILKAQQELKRNQEEIDMVIYCAGDYAPMRAWNIDCAQVEQTLAVNLLGAYRVIASVVEKFMAKGQGHICLVSSVAGYTGLPKALAYGPSKAALSNLAQVLYTDLSDKGIGVTLVNPGFVDTRLTKQNDFEMPALLTSEQAAQEIVRGLQRGHFEIHFPKRFSCWMKLLSSLPDRLRFFFLKRVA